MQLTRRNSWPLFRPSGVIAGMTLLLVVGLVVLGPVYSPWEHEHVDWNAINQAPSYDHWFGTDNVGRDLFTRTMVGGRVSLMIALLATIVSFAIGLPWGATAGFIGGIVDNLMMRFVDGLYAIPVILLVILLVVLVGRDVYLLFIGLGAVSWTDIARITRSQTLVVRSQSFISAAQMMGVTRSRIILRHVVPNVVNPALVYASLMVPGVVIAESFISFLGLGVQEPLTSLGVLIADGTKNLYGSSWQLIYPTAFLAVTLLALNTLGDRLRESLEIRQATLS